MITTEGKTHIKGFLAGWSAVFAQSIAFGLGSRAEAVDDERLQFEVGRSDITISSYDFVNDKLIFKATLPDDYEGTIYEVGLFSAPSNALAGQFGSRLLATFDSATEEWSTDAAPAVFSPSARIGIDSLSHTPAAGLTATSALTEIILDFSGHSGADEFVFAYNVGNANASDVRFRFMTDTANYYEFALGAQTAGYKIVESPKSSATIVGNPDWENIMQIQVVTTAGAGAADVTFDGIRIEDTDTINTDYVMISRELLATPFVKENGRVQEVEFSLEVAV